MPGPGKRSGPATTPGRSPENSTTADEARDSLTDAADVSAFLELSDALDVSLQLRLADWREGYEAGRADGIEEGRQAVLAEEAAAQRAAARHLRRAGQIEGDRWTVRGQRRDRASFGKPHKGDRPGRKDAA